MAFWGKSFSDIGNLFKTAVGGAIADTNAKLDLSVTKTEKLKAVSSGAGQGFKGIFGSGKINLQEQITKAEDKLAFDKLRLDEIAAGYEKAGNKSEFLNKKLKGTSEAAKEFSAELVQGKKGTDQFVVAQEQQIAALKATSLSSKAAAVGMKAMSVAMNVGVMLPCLNNHCFILIVKGGININQLKKSYSLKGLKDCEVAFLGVKENERIITKKIIKKYKRKIKSNSFKLKISVLLSSIGIKCKKIKTVD